MGVGVTGPPPTCTGGTAASVAVPPRHRFAQLAICLQTKYEGSSSQSAHRQRTLRRKTSLQATTPPLTSFDAIIDVLQSLKGAGARAEGGRRCR